MSKGVNQKNSAKRGENRKKSLSKSEQIRICKIGFIVFKAYLILLSIRYIYCIYWVENRVITTNGALIAILSILPFVLWVYSTKFDEYNYRNSKRHWFYICCFSAVATINQATIYLAYEYLAKNALAREVTKHMTENKIVTSARLRLIVPVVIVTWIFAIPIKSFLMSLTMKERINSFKISHYIDERENKEHLYDLNIIKNLDTGQNETILEEDRYVHMLIDGQSGTGKTSSTIIPAVTSDLNKKIDNLQLRHQALYEMIKKNEAYVAGPYREINEYNVRPRKGFEKKYSSIYKTYPDCGMTIISPDDSLNDTIVELCEARGIEVNVIDPFKSYKDSKMARPRGIQNFYIPEELTEEEKVVEITDQASTFAEVLQATNDIAGDPDIYFRDINTSVTKNIAIVCMLAASIEHRQTDINEVHQCISEFTNLKPLINIIENHYDISVQSSAGFITNDPKGKAKSNLQTQKNLDGIQRGKENSYYETILFVKKELLGVGSEKMYDQARGLRNLIDKILLDPRYRKLLSMPFERSVSFSDMLSKNQVTIVNTGLKSGKQLSTALGLFFLLNFKTAVLKRPLNKLSPHFLWIDEASQYSHQVYDDIVNLFRKYKCAAGMAIQTLSQMEKAKSTAYLKDVLQGVGTQIVFGRVGPEEMRIYSEIAGMNLEDVIQERQSTTSMFAKNASQSMQSNITQERVKSLEGSQVRIKDFQEVSVYKVKKGRVLNGFEGKVSFIKDEEKKPKRIRRCNFAKFAPKGAISNEKRLTNEGYDLISEQKKLVANYIEKMVINTIDTDDDERRVDIADAMTLLPKDPQEEYANEMENLTEGSNGLPAAEKADEIDEINRLEAQGMELKKSQIISFGDLFAEDEEEEEELIEEPVTEDALGDLV